MTQLLTKAQKPVVLLTRLAFNGEHSSKQPELTLEIQLTKDGQVVVATPPSPTSTQGVTDFARIPFIGEFPLNGFQPGRL
jgi:hypothetical protein